MNRQTLNTLAGVFGRCFLLCVGFQVLVFGLFLGVHDWGYEMHSRFFALTPEQFDLTCYEMLAWLKTLGIALFLIPWASLKMVAAKADA